MRLKNIVPLFLLAFFLTVAGCRAAFDLELLAGGARGAGIGEAIMSFADDAAAMCYNPAGLAANSERELLYQSQNRYDGTMRQDQFYFKCGALGVGRIQFVSPELDYKETAYLLSAARRFGPRLLLGFNLRPLIFKCQEVTGKGLAADLGLMYQAEKVTFGFTVQDAYKNLRYSTGVTERAKAVIAVGGSYYRAPVRVAGSVDSSGRLSMGVETYLAKGLAARAGRSGDQNSVGFSFSKGKLGVDYSYSVGLIGVANQALSLKLNF